VGAVQKRKFGVPRFVAGNSEFIIQVNTQKIPVSFATHTMLNLKAEQALQFQVHAVCSVSAAARALLRRGIPNRLD